MRPFVTPAQFFQCMVFWTLWKQGLLVYLHFSIFVSHFKGKHKLKNADTFCCHQFLSSKIMNIAIKKMPFSQHFFYCFPHQKHCHNISWELSSIAIIFAIFIHPYPSIFRYFPGRKWIQMVLSHPFSGFFRYFTGPIFIKNRGSSRLWNLGTSFTTCCVISCGISRMTSATTSCGVSTMTSWRRTMGTSTSFSTAWVSTWGLEGCWRDAGGMLEGLGFWLEHFLILFRWFSWGFRSDFDVVSFLGDILEGWKACDQVKMMIYRWYVHLLIAEDALLTCS